MLSRAACSTCSCIHGLHSSETDVCVRVPLRARVHVYADKDTYRRGHGFTINTWVEPPAMQFFQACTSHVHTCSMHTTHACTHYQRTCCFRYISRHSRAEASLTIRTCVQQHARKEIVMGALIRAHVLTKAPSLCSATPRLARANTLAHHISFRIPALHTSDAPLYTNKESKHRHTTFLRASLWMFSNVFAFNFEEEPNSTAVFNKSRTIVAKLAGSPGLQH